MLTASLLHQGSPMAVTDKAFYQALGQRIAEVRKARGFTQQQIADQLGIAQQTLAHYEGGRLRIAAALLPPLSKVLSMSVEDMIGDDPAGEPRPARRGPMPRLQQQLERIQHLPKTTQRVVMQMLDAVIDQAGGEEGRSP